jgi:hypothetical protein
VYFVFLLNHIMLKIFSSLVLSLNITYSIIGQTATVTTWKNDAKAAYSIIHDDYGSSVVDGIWQQADTIAFNRGIKFTIGAISSSCEENRDINGYATAYEYAKEVMLAQHGHEIIAHSHTHDCAVGNLGWSPCNKGVGNGWGENGNFDIEMVECTESIETGTGHRPQYYIYPYDKFTNAANDKLKELGYIGSRTGWTSSIGESFYREGYENSDLNTFYPDADGFFRTAVQVFDGDDTDSPNHDLILNATVDNAINNGEWANSELHNVGNSGWGSVTIDGYRKHINYIQQKVTEGELWVGTVSEILTYQVQKLKYEPVIQVNGTNDQAWTVAWNSTNPVYDINVEEYLGGLNDLYTSSLTLIVNLDGRSGDWTITQNGEELSYQIKNKKFYIQVYPHNGEIQFLLENETTPAPEVITAIEDIKLPADFETFTIDLNSVFEDENTRDEDLIFTVSGNTNIEISITEGIAEVSSVFGWEGIETILFFAQDQNEQITSEEVEFVVNGRNEPYLGNNFVVPTNIQAEDFDLGGAEVSYHEEDDIVNSTYRSGDVDIIENDGFTVEIGNKEWLEYSIQVNETGYFDFDLVTASLMEGNQAIVIIDGEKFKTFDLKHTAELTYESNKIYNLPLESGDHIMRILAQGSFSFDSIAITTPGVNTLPIVVGEIADQDLFVGFNPFEIDLNEVFEDVETRDEDLVFSVSGNTGIVVSIEKGIATVSSTSGFERAETVLFIAEDFGGEKASTSAEYMISNSFENSNHSSEDHAGYVFTFDQSIELNCPETMVTMSESNPGFMVDEVGNGSLVFSTEGNHYGQERISLHFNDACVRNSIDLSHPEKQIIEVRIHSTVAVPEFLALLGDNNGVIADKNIKVHSLNVGWNTLTFTYGSMKTWGTSVMNPAKIQTIAFMVRKSYHHVKQNFSGTFTIDYVKIGTELVPCPDPHILSLETNEFSFEQGSTAEVEFNEVIGNELTYQWYKGDVALSEGEKYEGVNDETLVIQNYEDTDVGSYYTTITDECGSLSNSETMSLAIEEPGNVSGGLTTNSEGLYQLKVYPTPANTTLNVVSNNLTEELVLYSAQGVILGVYSPTESIDVSELVQGVYILQQGTTNIRFIKN